MRSTGEAADGTLVQPHAQAQDVGADILYISGTGRTGTTVLEILLASNPGAVGVGEMKHIVQHGFLENRVCACRAPARECRFWSSILAATGWDEAECARVARVIGSVERHESFPLLWAGLIGRTRLQAYRQANATLFKAVAEHSGARLIVDSSKYAGRALALAELFGPRVKVLHISRSPAELIRAFQKDNHGEQRPKRLLAVAIYYFYVLFCMWIVRLRLGDRCLSIRYEDLRREPAVLLARVEAWSGHSLAAARGKLLTSERFRVGHIVTGNRVRRLGSISFDRGRAEPPLTGRLERVVAGGLDLYRRLLRF